MKYRKLQSFLFGVFLTVILVSTLSYAFWDGNFPVEVLRSEVQGVGTLGPAIFILIYAVAAVFIPVTPFMALAGVFFGLKYGLIYSLMASMLSTVATFLVSRHLGKNWADQILAHRYADRLRKYNDRLERGAILDLIILRTLPIMPFNVLNILMGVSKISTQNYVIGTFFGLLPSAIITVYFGELITQIF